MSGKEPTSGSTGEFVLGGQAVIEGVMMKGTESYGVAVRKESGEVVSKLFEISKGSGLRRRLQKVPFVRGVVTMGVMMVIGYKALQYSADEAMEEIERAEAEKAGKEYAPEGSGNAWAMAGALVMALGLAVGLFFWLPLLATKGLAVLVPALDGRFAFNIVDGILRVFAFIAYVAAISLMKDVRRIFEYHGAEHKVVHAFEAKADLSPASVATYSRVHPRCGTSFLLFVMVVSIVVFSFIPPESPLWFKAAARVVLLPAVAGISYELLRLSARKTKNPAFKAMIVPGLWLQRITTREPSEAQIEVALASFRLVAPSFPEAPPSVG